MQKEDVYIVIETDDKQQSHKIYKYNLNQLDLQNPIVSEEVAILPVEIPQANKRVESLKVYPRIKKLLATLNQVLFVSDEG